MTDHCISCGEPIPEGRQVCPQCEQEYAKDAKNCENVDCVYHADKPCAAALGCAGWEEKNG